MKFLHSHPAFNDTVDSLRAEYMNDSTQAVVLCGCTGFSLTSINDLKDKYGKLIVFNQEQLMAKQRNMWSLPFYTWIKLADEVWDYDEENIKVLRLIRPDVKLHILKPYKKWPSTAPKDIDILFYGTLNDHRSRILNHLSSKHKVKILTNCYDSTQLDSYILRSKILLNLHYYYETELQEQARMIRWIGSPCRIISEPSKHNYLNIEEMSIERIMKL